MTKKCFGYKFKTTCISVVSHEEELTTE